MKKYLVAVVLVFLLCEKIEASSYHFKGCKLSNAVTGDYIIDFEKKLIEVTLKAIDGTVQNFSDQIKIIEENKIISEKIKSSKGENIYYQYFLDSKSNTVIKLQYTKQADNDLNIFKLNQKRESFCEDVKSGWNKERLDEADLNNEQKQILKEQEKIKKEQSKEIQCQDEDYNKWTKCKGTFLSETRHEYDGLFINGKIVKGISIYPGGAKYIGEFKNFLPNGFGTFFWKNGDKYYGEWKDGKANGNGTKIWKNGDKYLGTFKDDKLHGSGTLFYPDGKKYSGEFINGKRHGKGTFTYPDGTGYIGNFIAGKQDGVGECFAEDGSSVICKSKSETQAKDFSGKDVLNISIVAKKWVRISQYENNSGKGKKIVDKLKTDFETKASELCAFKGNYKVLDKKVEVLEIDETPAYGLETKLKIGINGVVECI